MNQPLMLTASQKAGPKVTIAVGAVILVLLLALPLLSLLSPDSVFHVSAYTLTLVGKILCYAIVALALVAAGCSDSSCDSSACACGSETVRRMRGISRAADGSADDIALAGS